MATVGNEPFLSLESKAGSSMTVEEERDYYRQRFQSMKLVLKELHQQLAMYKTRCSGVNTVALMLKESKLEVLKLTKQRKAFETAVANLQNRLSTNGLSCSVNIEETELFVPGASKQTLDNLAKENARLRTLLKSHEGQIGRKSSEDIQSMTILVEKLEKENKQLQAQLLEMENLKLALAGQFEKTIENIRQEHQAEKQQFEQELSQFVQGKVNISRCNESADVERLAKASQTVDVEPSKVDEVRQALRIVSDHCLALDQTLENVQVAIKSEKEQEISIKNTSNKVSEEEYRELQEKLSQVIQMNQRWQLYNKNQEQQIHGFLAKIGELEQLNKESEGFRNMIETKDIENQNLRRDIGNLTQEVSKLRSQPQFDMSLVEILKQQIQVCTEDFNTERKDREHAVNRIKHLQEEVNKLNIENELFKKDIANLQKIINAQEYEKRESQTWMRSKGVPYFSPRVGPMPPQRLPFSSSTSPGTSTASSLSPVPSPVPMSFSSSSSTGDRSYFYPSSSQENVSGFQTPSRGGHRQQASYSSSQTNLPQARGPQEGPPASGNVQKPAATNISMPNLSSNTEALAAKSRQPDLTCPKCSKEFTESQESELINHINNCKD